MLDENTAARVAHVAAPALLALDAAKREICRYDHLARLTSREVGVAVGADAAARVKCAPYEAERQPLRAQVCEWREWSAVSS